LSNDEEQVPDKKSEKSKWFPLLRSPLVFCLKAYEVKPKVVWYRFLQGERRVEFVVMKVFGYLCAKHSSGFYAEYSRDRNRGGCMVCGKRGSREAIWLAFCDGTDPHNKVNNLAFKEVAAFTVDVNFMTKESDVYDFSRVQLQPNFDVIDEIVRILELVKFADGERKKVASMDPRFGMSTCRGARLLTSRVVLDPLLQFLNAKLFGGVPVLFPLSEDVVRFLNSSKHLHYDKTSVMFVPPLNPYHLLLSSAAAGGGEGMAVRDWWDYVRLVASILMQLKLAGDGSSERFTVPSGYGDFRSHCLEYETEKGDSEKFPPNLALPLSSTDREGVKNVLGFLKVSDLSGALDGYRKDWRSLQPVADRLVEGVRASIEARILEMAGGNEAEVARMWRLLRRLVELYNELYSTHRKKGLYDDRFLRKPDQCLLAEGLAQRRGARQEEEHKIGSSDIQSLRRFLNLFHEGNLRFPEGQPPDSVYLGEEPSTEPEEEGEVGDSPRSELVKRMVELYPSLQVGELGCEALPTLLRVCEASSIPDLNSKFDDWIVEISSQYGSVQNFLDESYRCNDALREKWKAEFKLYQRHVQALRNKEEFSRLASEYLEEEEGCEDFSLKRVVPVLEPYLERQRTIEANAAIKERNRLMAKQKAVFESEVYRAWKDFLLGVLGWWRGWVHEGRCATFLGFVRYVAADRGSVAVERVLLEGLLGSVLGDFSLDLPRLAAFFDLDHLKNYTCQEGFSYALKELLAWARVRDTGETATLERGRDFVALALKHGVAVARQLRDLGADEDTTALMEKVYREISAGYRSALGQPPKYQSEEGRKYLEKLLGEKLEELPWRAKEGGLPVRRETVEEYQLRSYERLCEYLCTSQKAQLQIASRSPDLFNLLAATYWHLHVKTGETCDDLVEYFCAEFAKGPPAPLFVNQWLRGLYNEGRITPDLETLQRIFTERPKFIAGNRKNVPLGLLELVFCHACLDTSTCVILPRFLKDLVEEIVVRLSELKGTVDEAPSIDNLLKNVEVNLYKVETLENVCQHLRPPRCKACEDTDRKLPPDQRGFIYGSRRVEEPYASFGSNHDDANMMRALWALLRKILDICDIRVEVKQGRLGLDHLKKAVRAGIDGWVDVLRRRAEAVRVDEPGGRRFEDLLPQELSSMILKQGYKYPLPVQERVWQALGQGPWGNEDLVIHHYTGSGKTLAFLGWMFKCLQTNEGKACVVTPDEILQTQVLEDVSQLLAGNQGLLERILFVNPQSVRQPSALPDLSEVGCVVFDEWDLLLQNYADFLWSTVVPQLPRGCVVCFCSATMSTRALFDVKRLTRQLSGETAREVVTILSSNRYYESSIKHFILKGEDDQSAAVETIVNCLKSLYFVIFTPNRESARTVANNLLNLRVASTTSIQEYKDKKARVVVLPKGKGRGFDAIHTFAVIMLEVTIYDPVTYIHCAGRAGRVGIPGFVIVINIERGAEENLRGIGVIFEEKPLDRIVEYCHRCTSDPARMREKQLALQGLCHTGDYSFLVANGEDEKALERLTAAQFKLTRGGSSIELKRGGCVVRVSFRGGEYVCDDYPPLRDYRYATLDSFVSSFMKHLDQMERMPRVVWGKPSAALPSMELPAKVCLNHLLGLGCDAECGDWHPPLGGGVRFNSIIERADGKVCPNHPSKKSCPCDLWHPPRSLNKSYLEFLAYRGVPALVRTPGPPWF